MDVLHGDEERRLIPKWAPELVVLSLCISWIGAYTSTQIIIHAKYTQQARFKWMWTLLASVAFGFSAIWSMHFVGMLACRLDVDITYDIPSTIFSAFVAVFFTFAALSSAYLSEAIENSRIVLSVAKLSKTLTARIRNRIRLHRRGDLEAGGYLPVSTVSDTGSEQGEYSPVLDPESQPGDDRHENQDHSELHEREQPRPCSTPSFPPFNMPADEPTTPDEYPPTVLFPPHPPAADPPSRSQRPRSRQQTATARITNDNSEDSLSTDDSESTLSRSQTNSTSQSTECSGSTLSSTSFNASLHAGLSRETRLRIKAQARDRPVPEFGWKYWTKALYQSISILLVVRAVIWALAVVFMHYCGMWAMMIPMGRISWDLKIVALSYAVALAVCFVGCLAMVHMEVHFGRQVAFSTISALGISSMHYTGMAAATFYTRAPPNPNAAYPAYFPFTIVGIAIFVCVISNGTLAHSAISSRNRMAEMILTKRRLWRIMAEKEAAEQANELKQQFISVASHEIRTPLHAVNGYCELLALTNLTEEQSLYVTSIQQACHAINVIAGNVLDFSKLDRNNLELSARPVLVDLRKMTENLARITETKGVQPGEPGVDVIVSVANDVPVGVYLDETYTFRILMNLLSNAQKFCESGYICVSVSMGHQQIVIQVSDTGCGIPKSFRSALFQPFRQADTSLTRPRQGTGLGLSIVKHLLQRMNGTIDVNSVEGEGSTFTVKLPIQVANRTPPSSTKPLLSSKKIKIIYRHQKTALLYADLCNQLGCVATVPSNPDKLSFQSIIKDTDAIWTDVDSIKKSPALMELIGMKKWRDLPAVYIVHSDKHELSALEPSLSTARGVVLIKRPVVMHNLLPLLENPEAHAGLHTRTGKVRFALPNEGPSPNEKDKGLEDVAPSIPPVNATNGTIPHVTSTEASKGKVLLVEDNMVNQHLGKRLLQKLGYEVDTASDGQEAVDMIGQSSYLCCLMDCQMPVLDGLSATAKVRELETRGIIHGRLPIIALTANVSNENEDKCKAAGMDRFLPKPLKLADLQATIAQFDKIPER
ncbi:hypothetical protein ABKN59_003107 [Abortiporus biennis]